MTLVLIIVAGALLGWLAGIVIPARRDQDPYFDIAIGMLGAIVVATLTVPLLGGVPITGEIVNGPALLGAIIGAMMVLGVSNVVRRDSHG